MITESWGLLARRSASKSSPLRSGNAKSRSTRSNDRSPRRAIPSSPLTAHSTSYPSSSNKVCRDSRIPASSSIIKTEPAPEVTGSPTPRCEITAASDIDSLPGQGEIKVKRGALPRMAFHANLSGVFLNNSVGDRQPQARTPVLALAGSCLGGEKGIVNPVDMFLRDPAASIGDNDADAIAVGGRDSQSAPRRHRVSRIHEQVQENLLQAPGVAGDERKMLAQFVLYADPRGLELMLEQGQGVGDNLVDVYASKLRGAGAREIEQVVDDLRGPETLPGNLLEQAAFLRVSLQLLGKHLRVRRDHGEGSVHLVRHSSRKQADG